MGLGICGMHYTGDAGQPSVQLPVVRQRSDAPRQVERGEGGQRRDDERERDEPKVVGAVHGGLAMTKEGSHVV
jgi:hypothetical protein